MKTKGETSAAVTTTIQEHKKLLSGSFLRYETLCGRCNGQTKVPIFSSQATNTASKRESFWNHSLNRHPDNAVSTTTTATPKKERESIGKDDKSTPHTHHRVQVLLQIVQRVAPAPLSWFRCCWPSIGRRPVAIRIRSHSFHPYLIRMNQPTIPPVLPSRSTGI